MPTRSPRPTAARRRGGHDGARGAASSVHRQAAVSPAGGTSPSAAVATTVSARVAGVTERAQHPLGQAAAVHLHPRRPAQLHGALQARRRGPARRARGAARCRSACSRRWRARPRRPPREPAGASGPRPRSRARRGRAGGAQRRVGSSRNDPRVVQHAQHHPPPASCAPPAPRGTPVPRSSAMAFTVKSRRRRGGVLLEPGGAHLGERAGRPVGSARVIATSMRHASDCTVAVQNARAAAAGRRARSAAPWCPPPRRRRLRRHHAPQQVPPRAADQVHARRRAARRPAAWRHTAWLATVWPRSVTGNAPSTIRSGCRSAAASGCGSS